MSSSAVTDSTHTELQEKQIYKTVAKGSESISMHGTDTSKYEDELVQQLRKIRLAAQHLVEQMRRDLVRLKYFLTVEDDKKSEASKRSACYLQYVEPHLGPAADNARTQFKRLADDLVEFWNQIRDRCWDTYPPGPASDLRLLFRTKPCYHLCIELSSLCNWIDIMVWARVESFIPSLQALVQEIDRVITEDSVSSTDEECEIFVSSDHRLGTERLLRIYFNICVRLSKKQLPIFKVLWDRKSKEALAVSADELCEFVEGEDTHEALRKAISRIEKTLLECKAPFLIEKARGAATYKLVPTGRLEEYMVNRERKDARVLFEQAVAEFAAESPCNE